MPVDVVVDGPRGRRVRAVWRRTPTVVGAILVCSAAMAALPLIALTIAVGVYLVVWIDFRAHPEKVWPDWFEGVRGMLAPMWLVALSVTTVGVLLGLRLLRENRNLILFLRRFGYRLATQTVTEATSRLGDFWRVVTLDDENIEALGPGEGVEGFVEVVGTVKRSYRSVAPVVVKGWKLVMRAAAAGLALALVLVVSPGPDWTARGERLALLIDLDQKPASGAALSARLPLWSSSSGWRWSRCGSSLSSSGGCCRSQYNSSMAGSPAASRPQPTPTSCTSWSHTTSRPCDRSSRSRGTRCSALGSPC
jgi:hypothetical protein